MITLQLSVHGVRDAGTVLEMYYGPLFLAMAWALCALATGAAQANLGHSATAVGGTGELF